MNVTQYFKDSVVRDANGNLLPVYHGSGTHIEAFDPAFTGQGADQYGSGFYFTTSYDTALGYTTHRNSNGDQKPGGEDSPTVLECFLNITNPIQIDGKAHANLSHIDIPCDIAYRLFLYHSGLFLPIGNYENPLEDYFDFGTAKLKGKRTLKQWIRRFAEQYYNTTDLRAIDVFFGQDHATELRHALRDVLGYDGVCADFGGQKHWIAWFPEQIKLTSNKDPELTQFLAH